MSVAKARHILGKNYSHLTDDQVIEIIHVLQLLARKQLSYNGSKKAYGINE
jgi:hypothetical protein